MAKGQIRRPKEKKKPKAEKKAKVPSAYQQLYKAKPGAPTIIPPIPGKKEN
jgi:hypothetical protein